MKKDAEEKGGGETDSVEKATAMVKRGKTGRGEGSSKEEQEEDGLILSAAVSEPQLKQCNAAVLHYASTLRLHIHRKHRRAIASGRQRKREAKSKGRRRTSQYLQGSQGLSWAVRYSTRLASSPVAEMSSKQHWEEKGKGEGDRKIE